MPKKTRAEAVRLCERPEVIRVVNHLVNLADEFSNRLPPVLMDGHGNVTSTTADIASAIEGLGFKAEWVGGTIGRRKTKLLRVTFPTATSAKRAKAALGG